MNGNVQNDPAFPVMTMDILGNVLSRADNPASLGHYLTEELRELTGAQCVVFLESQTSGCVFRVDSVNPARRREWVESTDFQKLLKRLQNLKEIELWNVDRLAEEGAVLRQEQFHTSLAIPLHAGTYCVGALLMLGLPQDTRANSVINLLQTLSTIVALVMRNAYLYEHQDSIIAQRTQELRSANQALKLTEAALEKRLVALTRPLDDAASIEFDDLFVLEDIQKLQDQFSRATGVASIITRTDGKPITKPSNFCRLCEHIIRKTERGLSNCFYSDSVIGRYHAEGPIVQPCLSGGLWDAGASISVGGRHIANWLIGQVRNEVQDESKMRAYARDIGVDESIFMQAFKEVPSMSESQFREVAKALFILAGQLSSMAYQNVQQARLITELKRAEESIRQSEERLREAQKLEAIGQLAGGVAHDFNNILAATMLQINLLLQHPGLDAEMIDGLKELDLEANRAASLTRQLLMFSRRSILQIRSLNLNEVVDNLLKMLRRVIGEHIDLRYTGKNVLPCIDADAGMLEQIVMNLAVNARDAMPQGGILTITTDTVQFDSVNALKHPDRREGAFVCLMISDTGYGMDEKTQKRIFEPFFTTKEVGKGTGLGLATVYGIAKQHHGWIEVESQTGKGSAFYVYLPASDKPFQAGMTGPNQTAIQKSEECLLVVEDESSVRGTLVKSLALCGYKVYEASNGQAALTVWEQHKSEIQLLISDIVLPGGINGLKLAQRLKRQKNSLKIILSSGYSTELANDGGINQEDIAFLPKPYSFEAMAETIKSILKKT